MIMKKIVYLFAIAPLFLISCISSKKFRQAEAKYGQLDSAYLQMQTKLRDCESNNKNNAIAQKVSDRDNKQLLAEIDNLKKMNEFLKNNNNSTLNELQDLSVISTSQAESIKKSLDHLGAKDSYIKNLQSTIARKDSLTMALVRNLKSALDDINDQDINIKVDKGVVYVDISDKMLFNSGSFDITPHAKMVLGKVAKVLNAHPDIEFMIEGNTDSNPYHQGVLLDNWDLSVKRATSVARLLQNNYGINPKNITAAGRSEYSPVASNTDANGRSLNRRTRIVILPQLDQFFKLVEAHK